MKNNDKELFDNIADKYAEKDIYLVPRLVREFQVVTLVNLLNDFNPQKKN